MMTAAEIGNEKGLQAVESTVEGDGINLQCVNSSDFVVGKQTTFNGPVTIINCREEPKQEETYKTTKEEIVIKQKIITPSTVAEIQAFAENKTGRESGGTGKGGNRTPGFIHKLFKTNFLKVPLVLWLLLLLVIVIGCIVFVTGKSGNTNGDSEVVRRNPRTITYNGKQFNFISREDWNARTPLLPVEMKTPVHYVVISHTASRFCYLLSTCKSLIRDIQADHMTRSEPFSDIAYSFMVGGDGNIYEGRGWTVRNAVIGFANANNVNINFIGSFENLDPPTYPQTEAVQALIEYGVNNSYIGQDYELISANTTTPTLSPGIQVYKVIEKWSHFEPDPKGRLKECSVCSKFRQLRL